MTIAKAKDIKPIGPTPASIPLSLPNCAKSAQAKLNKKLGCKASDSECICSKPKYVSQLLSGCSQSCNSGDLHAVRDFAAVYCGKNPKTIPIPSAKHTVTVKPSSSKSSSRSRNPGMKTRKGRTSTVTYQCSPIPSTHTAPMSRPTNGSRDLHSSDKGEIGRSAAGRRARVDEGLKVVGLLVGGLALMAWALVDL